MLDKQVFETLLTELATYYKRPVTPFVQDLWYSYLSDRLSTEQFTHCVTQYLLTAKSMPTPEQLVDLKCEPDAPTVTPDAPSLIEWDVCVEAAPRPGRYAAITELSPQGQFALRLVGGLNKLGMADEDERALLKRHFLNVWEVMRAEASAVPRLEANYCNANSKPPLLLERMSLNGNGKNFEK